jgi:hypothetical protein
MDALTPWLILIITALVLVSVTLYFQLKLAESESRNRDSIHADELREVEAVLQAALEQAPHLESRAAAHERPAPDPLTPTASAETDPKPKYSSTGRSAIPAALWRSRAADLARAGKSPLEIARELALPVGEVELALALSGASAQSLPAVRPGAADNGPAPEDRQILSSQNHLGSPRAVNDPPVLWKGP